MGATFVGMPPFPKAAHTALAAGYHKVISCDMGGTSFNVGVIRDDVPTVSADKEMGYGLPVRVPARCVRVPARWTGVRSAFAAGLADDQMGGEHHRVGAPSPQDVQKHAHRAAAQLRRRLADRGDRRVGVTEPRHVVE